MKQKVETLLKKYESWKIDIDVRLQECFEKEYWETYFTNEIHSRYIENIIVDLKEILNEEKGEGRSPEK